MPFQWRNPICHSLTEYLIQYVRRANPKSTSNRFLNYSKHVIVLLMSGSTNNPRKTTVHYKKTLLLSVQFASLKTNKQRKKTNLLWFFRLFFKNEYNLKFLANMLQLNHQETVILVTTIKTNCSSIYLGKIFKTFFKQ